MVEVTRLNGQTMILNGDLIELIEAKPDTIVSLNTGRKLILRDSAAELVDKLFEYRRAMAGVKTIDVRHLQPAEDLSPVYSEVV